MKMNYLLKSKPKNENRKKIVIISILFLILTILASFFPGFIQRTSYTISQPFWKVGSILGSGFTDVKNYFYLKSSIIKKNEELEQEVIRLKIKELDYEILLRENQDLKSEIGRNSFKSRITSSVLSRPPRSPYDTLVIDVGSRDGVGLGDKVYFGDNIIIGFITNITPDTSLVSLFSTSNQKQEAILSRTGASFTITGRGGANFELEVPKDTDIEWGDTFVYPGLSGKLIASVYYIDANSQSSFKKIYLKVPINIFSTKYVLVE